MKQRKRIVLFSLLLIFISFLIVNKLVIFSSQTQCTEKVGIIDSSLSQFYYNITTNDGANFSIKTKTHGDKMIEFALNCQKNCNLYYYDAQNATGNITTESILQGLDWMAKHSVTRVNISLSSKHKTDDLQNWINSHNEITVFASYNNMINSFDYPAMYDNVIASGSNNKINYKRNDIKYKSNTICLVSNKFKIYRGNSYLSILSMLNKN